MLVGVLLLVGTCGFVIIEGWSILDSFYMMLIMISTVGYGEVETLSPQGRFFTSVLVSISLVTMVCWTAGLTSTLVSGELSGRFEKQRTLKMIQSMSDHTIVCGGGVTALTIVRRLFAEKKPVVSVVTDEAEATQMKEFAPGLPVVVDDPKSEFALANANVLSAANLVAAADCDYDNLLITITGKALGTDIRVLSCAKSNELASRMLKVGADEVICPFVISGEHVADIIGAESNSPVA